MASDNSAQGPMPQQDLWTPDWQLLGAPASEVTTATDCLGRTALHYAAAAGELAAVRQLLAAWPAAASLADTAGQLPIHSAAAAGQAVVVQLLLEAYSLGAVSADQRGQLPCHEAAKGTDLPTLKALLQAAPAAAATADSQGRLPLHNSARHLDINIIRLLLPGASIDAQCWLLLQAVRAARLEVVQLLLSATPYVVLAVDHQTSWTALHYACSTCSAAPKLVAALLGAMPALAGVATPQGWLPLHITLKGQSLATVRPAILQMLLQVHPAAATAPDAAQQLPLATALFEGSRELAELLLDAVPNSLLAMSSSTDYHGRTPAHMLAVWGLEAPLQQLVGANPALLVAADAAGALPIHYAGNGCQPGCLRLLLAAAPETALARDVQGQLPLHEAARDLQDNPARAAECVRLLLAAVPGTAAAADRGGRLPLHYTLHHGRAAVAAVLLEAAPEVAAEVADIHGESALVWAVKWQRPDLVRLVLGAAPALASRASAHGMLPLHFQAAYGHDLEVLRLLLEAAPGAALVAVAGGGWRPIHIAAKRGEEGAVRLLLESCPECAAVPDDDYRTPLHWACNGIGTQGVVKLLLAVAPSTAAAVDIFGDPPLHLAMWAANEELVPLLLAAAPEIATVKNRFGQVPLEYCWLDDEKLVQRLAAARQVLAMMGGPAEALQIISRQGVTMWPLYADVVARWQLQPDEWALVPLECPGLGAALPGLVARMDMAGAGQVVWRLPEEERQRLRCAALCLAQAQRVVGVSLPLEIVRIILAFVPCSNH